MPGRTKNHGSGRRNGTGDENRQNQCKLFPGTYGTVESGECAMFATFKQRTNRR